MIAYYLLRLEISTFLYKDNTSKMCQQKSDFPCVEPLAPRKYPLQRYEVYFFWQKNVGCFYLIFLFAERLFLCGFRDFEPPL